jgi:hypothetical protein
MLIPILKLFKRLKCNEKQKNVNYLLIELPMHATKPQIRGFHLNFGILSTRKIKIIMYEAVLRIRIRRIHLFLGLLDPDPDPSIIKQKNKKNIDSYCFVTSL